MLYATAQVKSEWQCLILSYILRFMTKARKKRLWTSEVTTVYDAMEHYSIGIGLLLLGGPEPRSGRAYILPVMFFSPRFPRETSTDRPETLPHDQNLAVFYKLTSKIRGCSPKKILGPKTCKISVNFGPLKTLISNISGTRQYIRNRKDVRTSKIPLRLTKKVRWTLVH